MPDIDCSGTRESWGVLLKIVLFKAACGQCQYMTNVCQTKDEAFALIQEHRTERHA